MSRLRFLVMLALAVALTLPFARSAFAETAWDYVGTFDGVRVSRKSEPNSGQFSFRGETVATLPIGKILAVFLDPAQRKFWVDRFADAKTLEAHGPLSEVYWIKFALPFPVSNRDYVLRAAGQVDATTHVFTATLKSVDDPRKPKDSCCVRATVHRTYYRFEALKGTPEKTKITVEVTTDPKGLIPDWLVNLIQKKWPSQTLVGLIRRVVAANPAPLPDYASWHQ